jgi:hypothetical protein
MFLLSETQGPTQFWERRIRRSFCQALRGQHSSGKGGVVVPSVRNSGANPILGKEDSLFILSETQGSTQFWERRIRCSFCQKLRGHHSPGKGGFVVPSVRNSGANAILGKGGSVVPSVRNSGANPVLGKKEDSLFLLSETQGPTQFWERRIRCSFCQKLRGQHSSGKGGFVVPSVRNSGARTILEKEDSLFFL